MDVSSFIAGNYVFEITALAEIGEFLDSLSASKEFTIAQKNCSVVYDAMSGDFVESIIVMFGEKITDNPSTSRAGYKFDGWFKEKEGINQWDFTEDTVLTDITLYAHWSGTEGLDYKSIENDTAYEVSGFKGISGAVYVQEYYDGKPVTYVSSFSYLQITSIQLADTINYIDKWAFESCELLNEIIFPEGIKYIGRSAFLGTPWFDILPDGPVYIGKVLYQFKGEAPESVIVENGTIAISDDAFYNRVTLKNLTLPEGLETIGSNAFANCSALIEVRIPASVTLIETEAFILCNLLAAINVDEENTMYCSIDGLLYTKNMTVLLCCPSNYDGDFNLPNNLIRIGASAFSGNKHLISIIIPDTLECIDDQAFVNCFNLAELIIPNNVKKIGNTVFQSCKELKTISLGTGLEQIGRSAFENCSKLKTVIINRPSSASIIFYESRLFNKCSSLTNIYFPDKASAEAYQAASGWIDFADKMSINPAK